MFGLIRGRRVSIPRWVVAALVLLAVLAPPYAPPTQQTYAAEPVAAAQGTYPVLVSLSIPAASSGTATAAGTLEPYRLHGRVFPDSDGVAHLSTQTPINVSGWATLVSPCVGYIKVTGTVVVSGVVPITVKDGTAPSSSVFASGTAQLSSGNVRVNSPGQQVTVPVYGTASIAATLSNVSVSPGKDYADVENPSAATLSGAGSASFTGTGDPFMLMQCFSYLPSVMQTSAPGGVIYRDDFSNPNSGWLSGEDSNCKIEYKDDKYRITVKKTNTRCMAPGLPVPPRSGGTFSVKMQRRSPDDYAVFSGMWFGQIGTDASKNRWEATVRSDPSTCGGATRGVLWLSAIVNGGTALFRDKCADSVDLDRNDPNLLRIVRGDGKVKVYINDSKVEEVDDSWLAGDGYFGLVVISGSQTPVVIDFDDFVIAQ